MPADAQGEVTLRLAACSAQVLQLEPTLAAHATGARELVMQAPSPPPFAGDFDVHGSGAGTQPLRLVLNGDFAHSQTVQPGPDGHWQARVDTAAMIEPPTRHRLVAWQEGSALAQAALSRPLAFTVQRAGRCCSMCPTQ